MYGIILLVAVSLAAGEATTSSRCSPGEASQRVFFEQPWQPVKHSEHAPEIQLGAPGKYKEGEMLEYFVPLLRQVPEVTTTIIDQNRDPSLNTRMFRTWKFDELSISAEVGGGGALWPYSIHLQSTRVALACDLRIGQPLARFEAVLGPLQRSELRPLRTASYLVSEEMGYRVSFSIDETGGVDAITWSIPRGH